MTNIIYFLNHSVAWDLRRKDLRMSQEFYLMIYKSLIFTHVYIYVGFQVAKKMEEPETTIPFWILCPTHHCIKKLGPIMTEIWRSLLFFKCHFSIYLHVIIIINMAIKWILTYDNPFQSFPVIKYSEVFYCFPLPGASWSVWLGQVIALPFKAMNSLMLEVNTNKNHVICG